MSCHAQSLPVRLHAPRLQAHYILGATDASHKLIQTLLESTKPLSKNFDLDKQPVLPALHQSARPGIAVIPPFASKICHTLTTVEMVPSDTTKLRAVTTCV